MANEDEIMRAFALISSIKENITKDYQVSEDWVIEYHNALDKVEKALEISLDDFRVPQERLKRVEAAGGIVLPNKKEIRYREGLWFERSILLQKVDAVMNYLQFLLRPEDRKIGFRE